MTDKQFEEFVKREARDYNRPPDVPHDEMWLAITAERQRRQERRGWPGLVRSPAVRWGLGLAATLVLGIGIGLNLDRGDSVGEPGTIAEAGEGESGSRAGNDVQRYATWQHLGRAEAFLTMFRADVRSGSRDYQIDNPARDLLTNTRLLQKSPAYEDPKYRELLDDLELVLMQIAQLEAQADEIEADFVAQGIEDIGVLLKLRAATPAEPALTGIQGVL